MKLLAALVITSTHLLSLPAMAAYGTPFDGWGFVQDDWQVVCDNTLTCRAAGYTEGGQLETPASILLTALPEVVIPKAQVQFLSETSEQSFTDVKLWLNGENADNLTSDDDGYTYDLNPQQITYLINRARLNTKIEIKAGGETWPISDKGMSAVLLKLDEVQGRVGTPMALVSKNSPNRQVPKVAKPKPVIKKAYAYSENDKKQLDSKTLTHFQAKIDTWVNIDSGQLMGSEDVMGECELVNPKSESSMSLARYADNLPNWTFTPIDANHTLASHLCWRGAYNEAYGYWLIDHTKPSKLQLITTAGNEYSDGEIWAIHKDRGIGDCWNQTGWVWSGQTFAKSEQSSTGLCRGFAGGAWSLPTYISEVVERVNMKSGAVKNENKLQ